jgi:hypothetical protein
MLRDYLAQEMLTSLTVLIDRPDAELRAALVVAQLVGHAVLRHVVGAEPLVHVPDDDVVSLIAPVIEGYLR